jgi:arylsulfatase
MLRRGFDRAYGNAAGGNYFEQDDKQTYLDDTPHPRGEGYYKTDAETTFALSFLDESVARGRRFFLYLAYHAPHWPLQAKPEDIARYEGVYEVGPDQIRRRRHERQIEMGLVDPRWKLSRNLGGEWNALDEAGRKVAASRMQVHAAMVDSIDQNVGRVIAKLKEMRVFEDTLIIFCSDNGACRRDGLWGDFMGRERFGYEYDEQAPIGTARSHFGIGLTWATVANTPLRKHKATTYEGGMASPLIVHWPALIANGGSITHQPAQMIDITPTCVEAAGVRYPEEYEGRRILEPAGLSLLPVFRGETREGHGSIYWHYQTQRAIRQGKWKAVGRPGRMELYDLEADRTETTDLSARHPELLQELTDQWEAWYHQSGRESADVEER